MREKEYRIQNGSVSLYGVLYLSDEADNASSKDKKYPLIISSHGFNGSYIRNRDYAERMTGQGFAFYSYDFYGGSEDSRSGGSLTEMSVLTEAGDLEAVLCHMRAQAMVDPDRIFLWGNSQGGYVSTYIAGKYPDWVRGLILLYPAYVIPEIAREIAGSFSSMPKVLDHWDTRVGRIYVEDALAVDIYGQMEKYPGKVLIVHGDKDELVPIRCSEEAVKHFPNVEFYIQEGSGHGFEGPYRQRMKELAEKYVVY